MPVQQAEVFEKVRTCLVDALGVDDDEVTPEATMVGDLGAESIDFLDIVFRLEKTFNIKIPRGELFPEDILSNAQYVQDGKVPGSCFLIPDFRLVAMRWFWIDRFTEFHSGRTATATKSVALSEDHLHD